MGPKKGSIAQYMTDDASLVASGKAAKGKAKSASSKRKQADEETLQSDEVPDPEESPKKSETADPEEEEGAGKTEQSDDEKATPPKKVKGNDGQTEQSHQLVQVQQAKKKVKTEKVKAEKVKSEQPEPAAQRRMIAKLHYLAKTGKPDALAEYQSKDVEGKRAWFHEVYKLDPNLPKYSNVIRQKTHFRSDFSYMFDIPGL